MAGYRRVNYYELCRLCTSSEGTKMHIFREEGRRRQLPTKIQICLPVQVCEDDSLPKIICSHCVEKLESFYDFRESCVNAESMLESYFTSLRYSDDFSREGKLSLTQVYVKEGSPPKKKPNELENVTKNNHKGAIIAAPDGLSSLVQAAGIQIVSDVDGTRVQQYKCAMQMQAGNPSTAMMEATAATAEARYTYEACGTASPRASDASPGNTANTSMETHQTKLEDGSTQCNETDFKNNGVTRQNQTSAESSDEGEVASHHQQQLQSVAFAAAVPGQEMLLHFSFKQERDGVLRTEEQTALQRSSIAQIGEFLRMKSASIVDNGVQASLVEVPSSPLRPCMRCGKTFPNVEDLQTHGPCNQDPLESQDKSSLGGGNIACDVCNKLFKRKEHLFQHRKLHTGERPYICTSCGKAFSRKEHLVRHTVSHTGQKAHACEMCGKSFSRKDNLHKHRKTHGIAGPYICEACGKSFVVKHNYVMHKSSHGCAGLMNNDVTGASLENPLSYKCDICNKGFAMKQYLLTHKQRHRSRGAKVNAANLNATNSSSTAHSLPVVPTVTIPSVASPSQPVAAVTVTPTSQPTATASGGHGTVLAVSSCDATLGTGSGGVTSGAAGVAAAVATVNSTAHTPQTSPSQQQSLQQQEQQQQSQQAHQQQQQSRQQQDDSAQQSSTQPSQQQSTVQLDPLALTHGAPLTTLPSSPLLAPSLLQHVNAPGVSASSANSTMAIHVSSAATAYLCNPSNDLLETYRRLHST